MMKHAVSLPVLAAFLLGCAGCSGHGFRAIADSDPISTTQDGVFIIRYTTYADDSHKLTGTLDQIGIRNNSNASLVVDDIGLSKTFRGQSVNTETEYLIFEHGDVFTGQKTYRTDIAPGEWLYFVFPTAQITEYRVGDRLILDFKIGMRSGSDTYTNEVRFEKAVEKHDLPWL